MPSRYHYDMSYVYCYYLLYNKCVYIAYNIIMIYTYNIEVAAKKQKETRNQREVAARADSFTTALRGVYAVVK